MKNIFTVAFFTFVSAAIVLSLPHQSHAQTQRVIMAGYKQKPVVATSASGMATVTLKGDTLKVNGDFEHLTSRFSGAYIMVNLKRGGSNQLYELDVKLNEEQTGGTLDPKSNTFVLSEAVKELAQEGNLYIIISSFEYKNGEIRGNISPMK